MVSSSFFSHGLKHRRTGGDCSFLSKSASELPYSSSPHSKKKRTLLPISIPQKVCDPNQLDRATILRIVIRVLTLSLKLAIAAAILSIGSFVLFVICMSIYNGRSVRDPCMVAQNSKEEITISLDTFKRDMSAFAEPTSAAAIAISASPLSSMPFEAGVPKIIHQQWKNDNVPQKFMKWRKKWLEMYPQPEYEHMLWTDKNGRELIVEHYPWFLETYDGYHHNINRADAARYFILHHYGGIYADLDYEPQSNFFEYLPPNQVAMVESPYYWNEKTQNCLMSSPKHDPFWVDLFTVLTENAEKEEVLEATGPILLDQAIDYSVHPAYVLPCENFQRVPLGEYDQTLWTTVYDREIMFRLKPISKNCGYYSNDQCHFGRHHNTVSYRNVQGKVL